MFQPICGTPQHQDDEPSCYVGHSRVSLDSCQKLTSVCRKPPGQDAVGIHLSNERRQDGDQNLLGAMCPWELVYAKMEEF